MGFNFAHRREEIWQATYLEKFQLTQKESFGILTSKWPKTSSFFLLKHLIKPMLGDGVGLEFLDQLDSMELEILAFMQKGRII